MEELLWVEKYRPKTVEKTIIPDRYKKTFQAMVDQEKVPNLILAGPPGVGKTTVARAMLEEMDAPYILINGSLDGGKETLRNEIKSFATSQAISGKRKFVILDEADYLSHQMQPALRSFMEQYSKNCGFILTCNYPHKIIQPLHSRCSVIEFKIDKSDKAGIMKEMYQRISEILAKEQVEVTDKKILLELIKKHFPDLRKVINTLQSYSVGGKIDTGILSSFDETNIKLLIQNLQKKDFQAIRKWASECDVDQHEVYDTLFRVGEKYVENNNAMAQLIMLIAEYQYKAAFAVNPEINLMAALVEMAINVQWKEM